MASIRGRGTGTCTGQRRRTAGGLGASRAQRLVPYPDAGPYRHALRERYDEWLQERDADNAFSKEQRAWLDHMAEHIGNSLAIEPRDFESGWFGQQGSLGQAHALFGEQLKPLMTELNERLAA